MHTITPCLWFDHRVEEAAEFYVSVFPGSQILSVQRYGRGGAQPEGTAMTVRFRLRNQEFSALNAGPGHHFTESMSFQVDCADQDEVDHYWAALTADGGAEGQCSWLQDRYGLSWQVVPRRLPELLGDSDPGRVGRVVQAMMSMTKIDVATLERAAHGG